MTVTALRPEAPPTGAATWVEVIEPGTFTTVQDLPGRVGYWHVGVPPSGPMDALSHRLANLALGNAEGSAALELTGRGPTLRFEAPAVLALGGASAAASLDGRAVPTWCPIEVAAGAVLRVDRVGGPGLRSYLAVRGGLDVPCYLGSRSTFTLGGFGGHEGRPLVRGDLLPVGDQVVGTPGPLAAGVAPRLGHDWQLGVLVGPHADAEFLTADGLEALLRATWRVHVESSRTGVRLLGPKPGWARADGGEAGLHPSNIHDTGYAIGAVDLTGDMPVILGPDGPSLGGFVCPAVVAACERWKLGQLAPGDSVRLVPWTAEEAVERERRVEEWVGRASERIEPLARPCWNVGFPPSAATGRGDTAVIGRLDADGDRPPVTLRRAGDRFLLVEFGDMVLDLELRLWVSALERWVGGALARGVVDVTAGVRSLLVQVDGRRLDVAGAAGAVEAGLGDLGQALAEPFASRVVHLPLSWDDPATHEATRRYMQIVRPDAPWCPWNIEFIRRVNGLGSVEEVRRIVFDASYLVLGLGDVYLGAPVATPLDPRHRLVTTKYNPARTWTPENAVGIGGAYMCIYGMEGPGGYQFVGRTVQVWNRQALGSHFERPWLLRTFDQIRFFPVGAEELLDMRKAQGAGELPLRIEETTLRLDEHRDFLREHAESIERFRDDQRAAFAAERRAWAEAGEL